MIRFSLYVIKWFAILVQLSDLQCISTVCLLQIKGLISLFVVLKFLWQMVNENCFSILTKNLKHFGSLTIFSLLRLFVISSLIKASFLKDNVNLRHPNGL